MKHSQLFIDSLLHPKKLAAYRMLPIGKVIQYVFLLVTIVTVFSFGQFTTGVSIDTFDMSGLTEYIEDIKWLLYPFAFLLLLIVTTMLIFLRISMYALAGLLFLQIMKRRGEYRHLWRTCAFSITWSTLLSIIFAFTSISSTTVTIISMIITLIILIFALQKYPKLVK